MINNIGETAGQVYQVLEKNGELTLARLKTVTEATDFQLSAAIGWLARENKVQINQKGKSIRVSLL